MFHAKDGWYFGRTKDGGVHIVSPKGEVRLDADTWASIVASVSFRGDTAEAFQEAKRLHDLEKQEINPGDVEGRIQA
ncbi:unnamed protein product, partial [marine sediment metagenome]